MKRRHVLLGGLTALLAGLVPGLWTVFRHPRFGRLPSGEELAQLARSPNFADGAFHNQQLTTTISNNAGNLSVLWDFYFGDHPRRKPEAPLPVLHPDLHTLDQAQDAVIWLGHSSWFVQLGGRRFLIDPVFSDFAAPFSCFNRAFIGPKALTLEEMPELDALLISHDHWDHLDYPTILALKNKIRLAICPLGVGGILEDWGCSRARIRELDWNQQTTVGDCTVHLLPARHFSGRMLARNRTLWGAFALNSPKRRLFYSGDSGYGPHFAEIGTRFSGFDLALLECGQYDKNWPEIHMKPEDTARAAQDLRARVVLPSHAGRFCIANHSWDDPFVRLCAASKNRPFQLATPRIGECMLAGREVPTVAWWEGRI